ncbi:MAG: dTDP-glucose 4,6-dehydratase [Thermodesulfobacteriota bacterium]
MKRVLVTGGAGFIGTNLVRYLLTARPELAIVNLDAVTYAGRPGNMDDLAAAERTRYTFVHGDIRDAKLLAELFAAHRFDGVMHLAAESHVDRSISGPAAFVDTNVTGTFRLLEASLRHWRSGAVPDFRFLHVSTDEVYGSLGETGRFTEQSPYDPSSPYSASKAASDHFVRACHRTYGLPALITNCSNNYGPYQFPEKLIPLMLMNIIEEKPLPLYGDGRQVRDWLYVFDHCEALLTVLEKGRPGETYNVGGGAERCNIEIVTALCAMLDERLGRPAGSSAALITHVADRPGHDRRYAIDSGKISRELGWTPRHDFESALAATVDWYLANMAWVDSVRSGAYRNWIAENYDNRGGDEA